MNDRWRLKNKIDHMILRAILGNDEKVTKIIMPHMEVFLIRESKLEEEKEKYGDDLEVLF